MMINIKNYRKDEITFKCDKPKNTIQRIEKGFRKIGLSLEYSPIRAWDSLDIYSGHLKISGLNFSSNGKGITPDLAKASAFAEMAERFSARLPFDYFSSDKDYQIIDKEKLEDFMSFGYLKKKYSGYKEPLKNLNIELFLRKYQDKVGGSINKINQGLLAKSKVIGYSLLENKSISIPLNFIRRISGTNGLSAGNTIEEAIVQGSNEIFERFVRTEIINSRIICPSIDPGSINDPRIMGYIDFIKYKGFNLVIKDLSLNGLFPCIGILFSNKKLENSRNQIKKYLGRTCLIIGSSFNKKEAMIRCFTEFLQGKTEDFIEMKNYEPIWDEWFVPKGKEYIPSFSYGNDYIKHMHFHLYDGNLSFLLKGPMITYDQLKFDIGNDCLSEIQMIRKIVKSLKTDFVVVDQTHPKLKFPAVRVIIPGYSDLLGAAPSKLNDSYLTSTNKVYEFSDFSEDDSWMDSEEKIKILISKLELRLQRYPFLVSVMTQGLLQREIDLFELLASLYYKIKDFESLSYSFKILKSIYPEDSALYEELECALSSSDLKRLEVLMNNMKGCYRFMLSQPKKNPFVNWCDSRCEMDCKARYVELIKLSINSFYQPISDSNHRING